MELSEIAEVYPETIVLNGYDECILGVVDRFGFDQPVILYSTRKIVDQLVDEGMSEEEALEWFHYNMIGAWVGDGTPAFALDLDDTHY